MSAFTTELIPQLPPHLTQRGGSADLVGREYLDVIKRSIEEHPRSQQVQIGPSEIGHPCSRRIAYKLLGQPEHEAKPNWKATVGTAGHTYLESAFDADNLRFERANGAGNERWLLETRVDVGENHRGQPILGHCDLYDRVTATVIDHKLVGPTQLKKYRSKGPGPQYRTQAHLYGRGWTRLGLPVDTVMVCFLPRDGDLADTYVWHEPYDEQVALDALQRLAGIGLATDALGHTALDALGTADAFCSFCPYFKARSTDLRAGCPGDPASRSTYQPTITDPNAPAFGAI